MTNRLKVGKTLTRMPLNCCRIKVNTFNFKNNPGSQLSRFLFLHKLLANFHTQVSDLKTDCIIFFKTYVLTQCFHLYNIKHQISKNIKNSPLIFKTISPQMVGIHFLKSYSFAIKMNGKPQNKTQKKKITMNLLFRNLKQGI